ncbi:hypothetical protein [Halorhodospira halochloris]|uniref:hypothetical protein n=1 Tax=Halorhodospira halochloris TaxID=1052 RepID=UPI0013A5324D|nr:hypothetical protein [Halorhodospira halochloris]
MEDAVNPSLEASWRHPWRQDLHPGAILRLARGRFQRRHLESSRPPGFSKFPLSCDIH